MCGWEFGKPNIPYSNMSRSLLGLAAAHSTQRRRLVSNQNSINKQGELFGVILIYNESTVFSQLTEGEVIVID